MSKMGYQFQKVVLLNNIICNQEEKSASYSNDGQRYWKNSRFKTSPIQLPLKVFFSEQECYEISKTTLEAEIRIYHIDINEVKSEISQMNSIEDIYDYVDEIVNKNVHDGVYSQMKEDLSLIEKYNGNKIVYLCSN